MVIVGKGYNIFDRFFEREKNKHFKVISAKAEDAQAQQIYENTPNIDLIEELFNCHIKRSYGTIGRRDNKKFAKVTREESII